LPECAPTFGELFRVAKWIDGFDFIETRTLLDTELRSRIGPEDLHRMAAVIEIHAREAHGIEEHAVDLITLRRGCDRGHKVVGGIERKW
jgi:hypothetical protein